MKALILPLSVVVFATSSIASKHPTFFSTPMVKTLTGTVSAINGHFANLVPLQRAIFLYHLGVPFSELSLESLAEEEGFRDMVLLSLSSSRSPITNKRIGHNIGNSLVGRRDTDPRLVSYLPSTYSLSAEDVHASLKDYSSDTPLLHLVNDRLIFLFGDLGRRDILEGLNKLDTETIEKLLYQVSAAWSLWMQQTVSSFDATEALGVIFRNHESHLKSSIHLIQEHLDKPPLLALMLDISRGDKDSYEKMVREWEK